METISEAVDIKLINTAPDTEHADAMIEARNVLGYSPLHYSVYDAGEAELVSFFIQSEADVRSKNNKGVTIEQTAQVKSPTVLLPIIQAALRAPRVDHSRTSRAAAAADATKPFTYFISHVWS